MSVSEARPYTTLSAELDDAVEYRGMRSNTIYANTDQATANHEAVRCVGNVMRSPHQIGIGKRLSRLRSKIPSDTLGILHIFSAVMFSQELFFAQNLTVEQPNASHEVNQ